MLRQQIAAHFVGHAYIAQNQTQDVFVNLAFTDETHGQNAQTFLESFRYPMNFLRARCRPAHIHLMGGTGDISNQAVVDKNRHDLKGIREMAGTHEAVIQQNAVAGAQSVGRKVFDSVPGTGGHGAEMAGAEIALGNQASRAVEQGGGEIISLPHPFGKGGVAQSGAQFLGNGHQGIPDHGQSNRVH